MRCFFGTGGPRLRLPKPSRHSSVLAQKLVIENRGCQCYGFSPILAIFLADDPSLAKNCAVLLPGDLFWHLKDHFDERVIGEALWAMQ